MGGASADDKYPGIHRKTRQRKSAVVCMFCRENKKEKKNNKKVLLAQDLGERKRHTAAA